MINDIERLQTRCTLLEGRLAKLERQAVDMFDTLTAVVDHLSASAGSPPASDLARRSAWIRLGPDGESLQDERAPERSAIDAQLLADNESDERT